MEAFEKTSDSELIDIEEYRDPIESKTLFGDLDETATSQITHTQLIVLPSPQLPWMNYIVEEIIVPIRPSYASTINNGNAPVQKIKMPTLSVNAVDVSSNLFNDWAVSHMPTPLAARALINNGNQCFINCILVPLIHCAPFVNMLTHFSQCYKSESLLSSLVWFVNEFKPRKKPQRPFSPEFVYEALRSYKIDIMKGRQEDADEFLIILLDLLDKELHSLAVHSTLVVDNTADSWTEIDRKHPKITTRTVT